MIIHYYNNFLVISKSPHKMPHLPWR